MNIHGPVETVGFVVHYRVGVNWYDYGTYPTLNDAIKICDDFAGRIASNDIRILKETSVTTRQEITF